MTTDNRPFTGAHTVGSAAEGHMVRAHIEGGRYPTPIELRSELRPDR